MAKKKQSTYEVIGREDRPDLYELMDEIVGDHHPELEEARIAIAWRHGWKADADGRCVLGQMKKASELDRQLHQWDFVILLNAEVWTSVEFSEAQQRALLDHELCHGAIARDAEGETRHTPEGQIVYRIRKHTIEEFHEIVERHGQWKGDIQTFVDRAMKAGVPEQMTIGDQGVVESVIDRALDSPAALARMAPVVGGGIESVTISTPARPGRPARSVTLGKPGGAREAAAQAGGIDSVTFGEGPDATTITRDDLFDDKEAN